MTRKTVSRHLANHIGLTICQSAPRRRAHLVDTALPQAPWLRPLVLLLPPFLFLHMPERPLLPHLVHAVTWLLEVVSAVLVAVVASEETLHLVAGEASVALVSAEAEAVVHLQAATAVGRAMSSATSKTSHRIKAHPQVLADLSLPRALPPLSVKTATLLLPHTLAPSDSHLMAKLSPTLPQVLAPVLLPPAMHPHPTVVQLNPLFLQVPATLTSATTLSHLGLQATDVASRKFTTRYLTKLPTSTTMCTQLSATSLRSSLAVAKLLPNTIVHASTSSMKRQRSCAVRLRRKRLRSARLCAIGSVCLGRARRHV
jgi:hypothetical protein